MELDSAAPRRPLPGRAPIPAALLAAAATLAALTGVALPLPLAAEDGPSYTLGGTVEARPFARYSGSGGFAAADMAYGQATSLGLELAASGARARAAASIEAAILSGTAAADAWTAADAAQSLGLDSGGLLLVPAYDGTPAAPPTLLVARVRTLYLKLDWDWLSLTAGRQVVKYRRGALWSPTDPFTELDLSGISPVRRGTDALRLVFPTSDTGALDLVAAPKADFSRGRYAARVAGHLAGIDAAAIGYRDGGARAWSVGADFHADLVLGLDGEALYSMPDSGPGWLRAACGADYSFGDVLAAAEYYYNGGGSAADLNAPGSHNVYATLGWNATDFLSLAASLVGGLSSGTWSCVLGATVDAAQNASVAPYARFGNRGSAAAPWQAEAGLDITIKF